MNPTTPRGTRTRPTSMPFGRRHIRTVSPTGSESVATWRIPPAFSSTPRAIWASASFFTRAEASASTRAASRAARARPSTSSRTFVAIAVILQYDQIVAVDHFVHHAVTEDPLDVARLGADDAGHVPRLVVDDAAGELAALGVPHGDRVAGRELTLHLDHARRQQALAALDERAPGARVHLEAPHGRRGEGDPTLARRQPVVARLEVGADRLAAEDRVEDARPPAVG